MREDLKTLNQKIDDGLKQCTVDSDKLVKSIQHQMRNEIKEEIEEVKATSLVDFMKEEMEKSLGNMASEIDSVKSNLNAYSLVNKRHDNKILLHSLNEIPDIIAITEFKPKKLNHELLIREFNLDGYNVLCHGLENKGGRGVLFYIASDIQVTVLGSPSAFQECIFLLLKGRGTSLSQNQLLLGNICLEGKGENYQVCSVQYCVQQLCTVRCTHI